MERAMLYERERDFEIKDAEVLKERELYRQRVRLAVENINIQVCQDTVAITIPRILLFFCF